jgi:DNA-binding NarL/FixJ family response regulator
MVAKSKSKWRVFIVDDHPLVREWLAGLLGKQPDLEVAGQAEDAEGALAAFAVSAPDVVIVDLALRKGSGLDLIKDTKTRYPDTAVIVLSMHEEVHYAERALRAGASGYLTKRQSTVGVVEAIRQVREGRIYASQEVIARLAERRRTAPQDGVGDLSNRELEVFQLLGQGYPTRRIAADLKVSMKTVQAYSARIKGKLGLSSGTALVHEAVCWVEKSRRA